MCCSLWPIQEWLHFFNGGRNGGVTFASFLEALSPLQRNSGPSAIKYQMPEDPAKIITSSVPPSYSVKIKEAGAPPSSYQGELQCPKISFSDHDLNAANDLECSH
ncbi:uncharacterized protein LOC108466804 isoform X2 [Gossypium arboreum]|uniref:uncharacterized protein LOC108466804 isoform X2 n=1 Tax=Gossypium arboreum TaxID=29729 RepID=UPI0008193E07|nr:uncharacterized protein LOC108466804 isoform X2 [Gossypium arboreum]